MKNYTTRLMAIGLSAAILTCGIEACGKITNDPDQPVSQTEQNETAPNNGTGSWSTAESTEVTAELRAIFDSAVSQLDGYFHEPVAYLGSQIVAGTNHAFLCKSGIVAQNAANEYVITYIYVDTSGNASFLGDETLRLPGTGSGDNLEGGWYYSDSAEVTPDIGTVLANASETLTGASYEAVAYIGSQVVAGTNHAVLCRMTPSVPDSASSYVLVYIYEDLDGNCEITETLDIDLGI